MSEEIIDDEGVEAEEAAPAPSTRDIIEKAVEAQREGAASPVKPEEPEKAKRFTQAEREAQARSAKEPVKDVAAAPVNVKPELANQPVPGPAKSPVSHIAPADFAQLPQHVQEALQKREAEVSNGFRVLQNYKGLDQFQQYIDHARSRDPSISFAKVMDNAVKWERSLQTDPEHTVRHAIGLAAAARGVTPQQFFQTLSRMPAPQIARQAPNQGLTPQHVQAMVQRQFEEREQLSNVQKFMADPQHPFASDVAEDMAFLIEKGKASDLQVAYDMAVRMNPQIHAKSIERQRTQGRSSNPGQAQVDRARTASKATVGPPRAGSAPASSRPSNPKSVKEAIQEAYRAQRGDD